MQWFSRIVRKQQWTFWIPTRRETKMKKKKKKLEPTRWWLRGDNLLFRDSPSSCPSHFLRTQTCSLLPFILPTQPAENSTYTLRPNRQPPAQCSLPAPPNPSEHFCCLWASRHRMDSSSFSSIFLYSCHNKQHSSSVKNKPKIIGERTWMLWESVL